MDLQRLESFLLAAETLSFSEAAKLLHITRPIISHHIKLLETEWGVELFDRSTPKLRLTEAGRSFLPWTRKLIQDSGELKETALSLQGGVVGNLRIAWERANGRSYRAPRASTARANKPMPNKVISASLLAPPSKLRTAAAAPIASARPWSITRISGFFVMVSLLRQDDPRHNPMRSIQSACQTAQLTQRSDNHADTAHCSRFPDLGVSSCLAKPPQPGGVGLTRDLDLISVMRTQTDGSGYLRPFQRVTPAREQVPGSELA
jgi:hypothetical protein